MAGVSGFLGTQREQKLTGLGVPLDNGFSGGNDITSQGEAPGGVGTLRRGLLVFDFSKEPERRGGGQPQQPGIVVAPTINPNIIGGGQPGQGGAGGPCAGMPPIYNVFNPTVSPEITTMSGEGHWNRVANWGNQHVGDTSYNNPETGYIADALRELLTPAGSAAGQKRQPATSGTYRARTRGPSESAKVACDKTAGSSHTELNGKTHEQVLNYLDGIINGRAAYLGQREMQGMPMTNRRAFAAAELLMNHDAGLPLATYGKK